MLKAILLYIKTLGPCRSLAYSYRAVGNASFSSFHEETLKQSNNLSAVSTNLAVCSAIYLNVNHNPLATVVLRTCQLL